MAIKVITVVSLRTSSGNCRAKLITMPDAYESAQNDRGEDMYQCHAILELGEDRLLADTLAARWAEQLGVPYIG